MAKNAWPLVIASFHTETERRSGTEWNVVPWPSKREKTEETHFCVLFSQFWPPGCQPSSGYCACALRLNSRVVFLQHPQIALACLSRGEWANFLSNVANRLFFSARGCTVPAGCSLLLPALQVSLTMSWFSSSHERVWRAACAMLGLWVL